MDRHNHITRDIKQFGECPVCDQYHNKTERQRWEEDFSEWCSTNVITHRKIETDEEGNVLFDIDGMKAVYFAGRAKERMS
jgi:hypothetical protein